MPSTTPERDLSIWEGDGLPEYEEWKEIVNELEMIRPEQEAWLESCKREAWVREKMANYSDEDREWRLAVARYFWRRADVLKGYIKRYDRELDEELAT